MTKLRLYKKFAKLATDQLFAEHLNV